MSRIPGLYPISVAILAGFAGWAAYGFGKGPSAASQVLASLPKQAPAKETDSTSPARRAKPVLDLTAEIERMSRLDMARASGWQRREEWEKIRSLSLPQVKEALKLVPTSDEKLNTDILKEMLYARWAELDPEEAMAAVAALPEEKNGGKPGGTALWTWVQRDPEAAQRWREKNAELARGLGMHAMLTELLLKEEPAIALEKAKHLGNDVWGLTLVHLTAMLAETESGRADFMKILETLPEDQRKKSLHQFALTWCSLKPEEGMAALGELIPDTKQQDDLRKSTLARWGRREPAETLAWMKSHPQDKNLGQQAFIWREWVNLRPKDAMEWLKSDGQDAETAEAIARHLQTHAMNDPMSGKVTQRQVAGLRHSYEIWSRAKPAEAEQWLKSADPKIAATINQAEPTE